MPTFGSPIPAPNVLPRVRFFARVKQKWADDWIYVPYLTPISYVKALAPEVGSAQFEWHFGDIKREDSIVNPCFSIQTVTSLRDWYVEILRQYVTPRHPASGLIPGVSGEEPQRCWIGVFADENTMIDRATSGSGVQQLTVFGLGHILDRVPLTPSRALENGSIVKIDWSVPFNRATRGGSRAMRRVNKFGTKGNLKFGNRSTDKLDENGNPDPEGVYVFQRDGEDWTNKDIVNYLVKYFVPTVFGDVTYTGQVDLLDSMIDEHDLEGQTLWGALNELIDRRRGLLFDLRVVTNDAGEDEFQIHVDTVTHVDIVYGSKTLPANSNIASFTLPTSFPYTHLIDDVYFRITSVNVFDTIEVRGERILVCGTFAYKDGTLVPGWAGVQTVDYFAPPGATTVVEKDLARSSDIFEPIFCHHAIPLDWDWRVGDALGGAKTSIAPTVHNDGTVTFAETAPFWNSPRSFERETPFQTAKDYSVSPPVANLDAGRESDYRPIVGLVFDAVAGTKHTTPTNKWLLLDKINSSRSDLSNVSVRALDKELGVDCNPGTARHYMAVGAFPFTDSAVGPEFDYHQIAITAAILTDTRPHIVLKNMAGIPNEVERRLTIDVPGAEYWYAAPDTVLDAGIAGGLKRIHADNLVLRDGKKKLEAVAAFARAWYGIQRQAVQLPIKKAGDFVALGVMLNDIRSVSLIEPVRTVVTAIACDCQMGTTTIETGWNAIDVVGTALHGPSSGPGRRERGAARNAARKGKVALNTAVRRAAELSPQKQADKAAKLKNYRMMNDK